MDEGAGHHGVTLAQNNESAKAVEPPERPRNAPAPHVAAHAATIVGSCLLGAVGPVWRQQLDVDAYEGGAQFIGV
jgi:hypothetical protein